MAKPRESDDDIRANLGILSDVDKRWIEMTEARGNHKHTSFMPDKIEMTKREYKEHMRSKGEAEHKKLKMGRGTYRGALIKVR